MSEPTIEEAWAALGDTLRWASREAMCRQVDGDDADLSWLEEEKEAVRVVLRAVLKAAMSLPEPPLLGTVEINMTEREAALRAQLEALGR